MSSSFTLISFATLVCGILLGGMVFFNFVATIVIRKHMPLPEARRLRQRLFPVYYLYNTALVIIAGIAVALSGRAQDAMALAIVGMTFIFARTYLLRAIKAWLPVEGESPSRQFYFIHAISMIVNFVQIGAVTWIMVRLLL